MRFKPHPSYEPTDVQWLREYPSHWEQVRFKTIFQERTGRSQAGEQLLLSVSAYTGVRPRYEVIEEGDHLSHAESLEGYKLCFKNDLVMNIMLAWNRGLGVTAFDGMVSPAYCVFSIVDGSDPAFLNYLVRSDPYIHYFKAFSTGVIDSRLRIYPETFGQLYCALPPISEQRLISTFLNRETLKVDALIAEQRTLIEKLREKRASLIYRAVTQGITPIEQRQTKPTEIKWAPSVPQSWAVTPLGYLVSFRGGGTPSKDNPAFWDGDIPWVSPKDMKVPKISDAEDHVSPDALLNSPLSMIPPGQLLVVVRGMILAHSFPVATTEADVTINQDMKAIACGDRVHPSFLYWYFRGLERVIVALADQSAHGTKKIESSTLSKFPVTLPPLEEQQEIAVHLEHVTAKLDALASESEISIALLQEHRSALVTAVVTGKIDVREVASV